MKYRPGDFYRICERTGFKVYASETRKEWTGRFVRRESYERRQPQDFVRGLTDRQVVVDPRPEPSVDNFVGPLTTTLTDTFQAGATALQVDDTTRMFAADRVWLLLDNGELLSTTILAVTDRTHLTLAAKLPWRASSGNQLTDLTAQSFADLGG